MGTGEGREDAVQLRLAGWSRSQIADALGLAGGGQPLSRWLRGVPPPAWTHRPRAKDDLREIAVAMRKEGRSSARSARWWPCPRARCRSGSETSP